VAGIRGRGSQRNLEGSVSRSLDSTRHLLGASFEDGARALHLTRRLKLAAIALTGLLILASAGRHFFDNGTGAGAKLRKPK
jgi:hypothetical protein